MVRRPRGLLPLKHGRYAESACQTLDVKKEKPKGKYELGSNAFTAAAGTTKFEGGAGTLECESGSAEGQLQTLRAGTESITYRGCKHESAKCASAGAPAGTIHTEALETVSYSEEGKFFMGMAGNPVMKYLCGATEYTVRGEVAGEMAGDLDAMSTHSEAAFRSGVGFQGGLTTEASSKAFTTTLTTNVVTTSADPRDSRSARPTNSRPADRRGVAYGSPPAAAIASAWVR